MKNSLSPHFLFLITVLFLFHTQFFAQKKLDESNRVTQTKGSPLSGGYVIGKAVKLAEPISPVIFHLRSGYTEISVPFSTDKNGNVISAKGVDGYPLLRPACATAAWQSKFSPSSVHGQTITTRGELLYKIKIVDSKMKVSIETQFIVLDFMTGEWKKNYSYSKVSDDVSNLSKYIKYKNDDYGESNPADLKLIWDDKHELKIWTIDKTAATVEELKKIGFVILQNSADTTYFVGSISAKNVEKLVASDSVLYINSN